MPAYLNYCFLPEFWSYFVLLSSNMITMLVIVETTFYNPFHILFKTVLKYLMAVLVVICLQTILLPPLLFEVDV